MKPILPIKKTPMPFSVTRSFFPSLAHASKVHGYKGLIGKLEFLWVRTKDHWLQVISRIIPYNGVRVKLQRMRGVKIGAKVHLGPMVTIDDVYPYFVTIEEGASISGQCFIIAHSIPVHYFDEVTESYVAPVVIGRYAWLAINVVVFPGVTIGEGSIIASGSVVTKSIPPFVMAAGAPAVIKKDISLKVRKNYTEERYAVIMEKRKAEFGI
ncbi:MAG: acetyltransferase [Candidatus Cloacimonetes bacterium HGW-Cloacimonetes-3]|jgi:acetyltransferase-like isoleucine patch superfamily enzyme|nr:MAG: acetyltransferase [Candidatus Cloacimonetes bacterium HGW-Cloacimonetes-3]